MAPNQTGSGDQKDVAPTFGSIVTIYRMSVEQLEDRFSELDYVLPMYLIEIGAQPDDPSINDMPEMKEYVRLRDERERRHRLSAAKGILYAVRNDYDHRDPIGHTRLWLERGLARIGTYDGYIARGAWSGQVDPVVLEEVIFHLQRGGFPNAKPLMIRANATFHLRVVTAPPQDSPESLDLIDNLDTSNDDYAEAIRLLNAIVRQASQDSVPLEPAADRVIIHDIRSINEMDLLPFFTPSF